MSDRNGGSGKSGPGAELLAEEFQAGDAGDDEADAEEAGRGGAFAKIGDASKAPIVVNLVTPKPTEEERQREANKTAHEATEFWTVLGRRMKITDATPHGFRSAFRDWCGEVSTFPREVAEAALAHVIGNKAEAAYRRGDALEKRRKLMDAWAGYCEPEAGANVVTFKGRGVA